MEPTTELVQAYEGIISVARFAVRPAVFGGVASLSWLMLALFLWFRDDHAYPWQFPAWYLGVGNSGLFIVAGMETAGYVIFALTGVIGVRLFRDGYEDLTQTPARVVPDGGEDVTEPTELDRNDRLS